MKKLYDGKCDNSDCDLAGERAEFWAEGVDEDGKLVDAVCGECSGRVTRALSPVRIGKHSGADHSGCGSFEVRVNVGPDGEGSFEARLHGTHHENCDGVRLAEAINSGRVKAGDVVIGVLKVRGGDRGGHTLH